MRTSRPTGRIIVPPLLLVIGLLLLPAAGSPAGAAVVEDAEVIGAPCDPGEGVTVVVDFTALVDEIHIGCAPGVRTNGLDVLTGAGFTVNDDGTPQGGSLCQVNGLPEQGYPFCWSTGGFWSYWSKTSTTDWGYAMTGAGGGAPRAIDSIEGWSWAPSFESAAPRIDENVDIQAPAVSLTSTPAATTEATDATFEFEVDDPTATTTCSLDGSTPAACSSPHQVTGLVVGDHTFAVTATDGLGNTSSATHNWTVEQAAVPAETCASELPGVGGPGEGLDWLACELDAFDGVFGSTYDDVFYTDVGMTLDVLLAFGIHHRGDDAAVQASFAALTSEIESYVNGFGDPTDRVAGGTAKALLTSYITGDGPDQFAGFDLEADLRDLMTDTGDQAGRFRDRNTWGDYSNGFSQALAIMALSHTDDGVPDPAVEFLLDQQCPSGGFRGVYENTPGCASDAEADTDYTAMALQALLTSPDLDGVDDATAATVDWLLDRQDATTGAFGGTGITAELNTNSSGLIAQGLRAAGRGDTADEARDWITGLQITSSSAAGGPAGTDLGAYAYGPAVFADAIASGIDEFARSQWQRATSQAVLAFGVPMFGKVHRITEPPSPEIELSVTSGHVGDEVTVKASGFQPGETVEATMHSTPTGLGSSTVTDDGTMTLTFLVPAVAAGAHRIELVGATSGLVLSAPFEVLAETTTTTVGPSGPVVDGPGDVGPSSGGSLPRTGSDATSVVPLGLALLALGAAAVSMSRRRRLSRQGAGIEG